MLQDPSKAIIQRIQKHINVEMWCYLISKLNQFDIYPFIDDIQLHFYSIFPEVPSIFALMFLSSPPNVIKGLTSELWLDVALQAPKKCFDENVKTNYPIFNKQLKMVMSDTVQPIFKFISYFDTTKSVVNCKIKKLTGYVSKNFYLKNAGKTLFMKKYNHKFTDYKYSILKSVNDNLMLLILKDNEFVLCVNMNIKFNIEFKNYIIKDKDTNFQIIQPNSLLKFNYNTHTFLNFKPQNCINMEYFK